MFLLRRAGLRVGVDARVLSGVFFGSEKCDLGEGCFVGQGCHIDGSEWVFIGDKVDVAAGTRLLTSSHSYGDRSRRAGDIVKAPIRIGDGSWIGASCTVLPGVTIADGCVIAAGAVVTRDTEPNGMYAGVPARRVKDILP